MSWWHARARALWIEGHSDDRIGLALGIDSRTVFKVRRRQNWPARKCKGLAWGLWTPELIERLERLWSENLATAEIGRQLGFSKNAIVGKAHRLGLAPRSSPIRAIDAQRQARLGGAVAAGKHPAAAARSADVSWATAKRAARAAKKAAGSPEPSRPVSTPPPAARPAVAAPQPARAPSRVPVPVRIAECCYVEGERPNWRYCGAPAERGAYCGHHWAVCHARRPSEVAA